jgi:phytoene dehydrogenase-like protein
MGELSRALAAAIRAHDGTVLAGAPATRIHVRDGRAAAVEIAGGQVITARLGVVAATHIHATIALLGNAVSPRLRDRARRLALGNGLGMAVRLATDALPDYTALPGPDGPQHRGIQVLCPDLDYLGRAHADFAAGRPSSEPAVLVTTFSSFDRQLAPAGKHVVSMWAFYHPYADATGRCDDEHSAAAAADRVTRIASRYAPALAGSVLERLVQTPVDIERRFAMPRANIFHLDMTPAQMFFMRPMPGLGRYRGPVRGLYLTGASTHPGGGIMGLSGRHAAREILHDLSASGIAHNS